jgi:PAS domain S-box-containing protein
MQDDNLSRKELTRELGILRRRVEELEADNSFLRKQKPQGAEGPVKESSDNIDAFSLPCSPEVREIENDYRTVVESASEAICITQDGVLKFCNPASTQLTGYSNKELLSRSFAALTHPEDLEDVTQIYLMRLRGELVPAGHRFRIIAKDGEIKWVESWSASIEWNGSPAVLSMIRDVTQHVEAETTLRQTRNDLDRSVQERKAELQAINDRLVLEVRERERAELSVRESEDRFQRLMEHSPMGVAVTGMNGEVEYLNKKFIQLFGFTLKDIPTLEHWWPLAYPDPQHADRVRSEWRSATREAGEKGTEAEPVEREVRCKDGRIRVVDLRKTVIDKWVIHTFHDVTDSKRQEEALLESEQMFRLLSEQSLMSVAILQEGVYHYVNDAMSTLTEYSVDEILSWGPGEFLKQVHPDDRDLVRQQVRMKQEGLPDQTPRYSFRIVTKSGGNKWVDLYSKTVQFKGRPAILITMLDITQRKKSEEALEKSQAMVTSILNSVPQSVFWKDLNRVYLGCNEVFARAVGLERTDEIVGKTDYDLPWPRNEADAYRADDHEVMTLNQAKRHIFESLQQADGTRLLIETTKVPLTDENGTVYGVLGVYDDITERKRAETELRFNQFAIDNSADAAFWVSSDGVHVYANLAACRSLGYSREELLGLRVHDIDPNMPRERWAEHWRETKQRGSCTIETQHRRKDGRLFPVEVRINFVEFEGQEYHCTFASDIAERKQAEQALQESMEKFRSIVENSLAGIFTVDDAYRFVYVNDELCRILGRSRENLLGLDFREVLTDYSRVLVVDRYIRRQCGEEVPPRYEIGVVRGDGNIRRVEMTVAVVRDASGLPLSMGQLIDITERKRAEEALRESEERLRLFWETSPDSFSITKLQDGLVVEVNTGFTKLTGYTREEIVGKSSLELGLWVDPGERPKLTARLAQDGEVRDFETKFRMKDGDARAVSISAGLMPLNGQQHLLVIVKDIEDKKRAQEGLARSEELFRKYFELGLVGMAVTSPEKRWVHVNDRICEMLGYTREELVQTTWAALTYPEDLDPDLAQFNLMLAGEIEGYSLDKRFVRKDGESVYTTLSVTCIRKPDGTVDHVISHLHDISERKLAEEALRKSEQLLRQVLDTIPVRLFWKDAESVYLGCNRLFALDSGLQSPEELVGKTDFDMAWREQAQNFRADDRYAMECGAPKIAYEAPKTTAEGLQMWVRGSKVPLLDPDGRIKGVLGTYEDITENKKAYEENLHLRRYVENIINSMPSLLVGVDRECRVTQWNPAAENMTGVSAGEARGKMLSDIMPMFGKQLEKVRQAMVDRVVQSEHKVSRSTDRGTIYEDVTVYPLASNGVEGAVIRLDDVTERVRMEEMMIQTEKMMSVGGLAAGMAHEINNPLGVIMQATQNILLRLSPKLRANVRAADECGLPFEALQRYLDRREIPTFLEDIRSSGQRAADVVSNMLSFSRKSEKGGSSESLSELLDRTLALAASDYDLKKKHDFRQIEIIRRYDSNTPKVLCEAAKIQQVFLNVLRNGAEAMQETRAMGREPRFILRVSPEGEMVRVEITDNGPGMAESVRRRVFEPFFTTKAPGVGTGLGMSVSYFIISDDHRGTMEVESSPGDGARFIIRLPVKGRPS